MSGDPNGTRWSTSENNYGKSILKKAGWAEGKGIGKDQEGAVSHVKVSRKDDVMGIGYKAGVQEAWSAQSVGFADVLERIKKTSSSTTTMMVFHDSDDEGDVTTDGTASPVSKPSSPSSPTESRHYKMYAKRNALKTELLRSNCDDKKEEILGSASSSNQQRKRGRGDEEGDDNASTLQSPLLTRLMARTPKHEPRPTGDDGENLVKIVKPNPRPPKCTESPFLLS